MEFRAWNQYSKVMYPYIVQEHELLLLRDTGKEDWNGKKIYEGDVITLLDGTPAVVNYGEYDGYCPYYRKWMPSVGFYVTGIGRYKLPMPLGPTEEYAEIIGNIYENPELLEGELK